MFEEEEKKMNEDSVSEEMETKITSDSTEIEDFQDSVEEPILEENGEGELLDTDKENVESDDSKEIENPLEEDIFEENEEKIFLDIDEENVANDDSEEVEDYPEEEKEKNSLKQILKEHLNFPSVLKKLIVLLILAFLFIFATTKLNQNSEKKIMDKNMNNIKNAAYQYFKENNRPSIENIEYTISLSELIEEDYIEPIKDKKGNVCDAKNSNVTLEKKDSTKYNLAVFLDCSSKTYRNEYTLTYAAVSSSNSETTKVYYKLKKGVTTNNYQYRCPTGYTLKGKYCYSSETVDIVEATAKYKSTSAKSIQAHYKKPEDAYEYVNPIVTTSNPNYYCSSKNATLVDGMCVTKKNYTLSNSCPGGYSKYNSTTCYKTVSAIQGWSDWKYISTDTYRYRKESTDTKLYKQKNTYTENNKTKYEYEVYTRSKTYYCENNGELKGRKCYYYVPSTEMKTCSSGYVLNENKTECIKSVSANQKVENNYTCPSGYESKGSGSYLKCYKKTTSEGYYYCKNSDYRLVGETCVRDAKVEFTGYKCPSGYDLSGDVCIKTQDTEKFAATKTTDPEIVVTYKWSDEKEEKGWTWTGETKEI